MNMRESQLDTTNVALKILNDGAAQDLETFFVTSWAIWHSRNQKVFEDVQLTKFGVLQILSGGSIGKLWACVYKSKITRCPGGRLHHRVCTKSM